MPKDTADHPHAIRFSKPLREEIAKFCKDFHKNTGVELNFSDAVRTLVKRGLKSRS